MLTATGQSLKTARDVERDGERTRKIDKERGPRKMLHVVAAALLNKVQKADDVTLQKAPRGLRNRGDVTETWPITALAQGRLSLSAAA
ncbi:unnamed protein product [Lampetra planeri]